MSSKSLHRSTRLAAVALYRRKFGESEFLQQFSARKLPQFKRMWLPGGYAYWKERSNNAVKPTAYSLRSQAPAYCWRWALKDNGPARS